MRGLLGALIVAVLGLGGGAHSHSARLTRGPLYYVPSAAIVQRAGFETAAQPSQVLPGRMGRCLSRAGRRWCSGIRPLRSTRRIRSTPMMRRR